MHRLCVEIRGVEFIGEAILEEVASFRYFNGYDILGLLLLVALFLN